MKKPLILSLATAALLSSNLSAQSMYERFELMENEINSLKTEISDLKTENIALASTASISNDDEDEEEDEEVDDNEESDEEAVESDDEEEDEGDDSDEDDEDDEEELSFEEETDEALEYFDKTITQLKKDTTGNHVKFSVDFRSSIDNIQYKMASDSVVAPDGAGGFVPVKTGKEHSNDALMTNRLWLNMNWSATKHISFTGQLAFQNTYGGRAGLTAQNDAYETFNWISNENPYDDVLRVRSAYFFYRNSTFFGMNVPWTFSLGRRPSTNGHLANYREDDPASSPSAHSINVEFDGLSSKFMLAEDIGMYIKFCAGRGLTNAKPRFDYTPYANDKNQIPDIDLGGFIFVPYDDGQYEIFSQFYYATNLIDAKSADQSKQEFQTVGGLYSGTVNFMAEGIGEDWSDFTDDTIFFVSGAFSTTNPDKEYEQFNAFTGQYFTAKGMLGSDKAETGYSVWVGLQIPALITDDGRLGFEYNWGSKYWRSITYSEDTLVGSKLATRGNAYEAYYTQPLITNVLSFQLRWTYIDYEYSGSNGFFGNTTGTPLSTEEIVNAGFGGAMVDTAQDIRAYLRYKF